MDRYIKATIALLALLAMNTTHATDDRDCPEDIPVTEPVTVGLAGSSPAYIVRYLVVVSETRGEDGQLSGATTQADRSVA